MAPVAPIRSSSLYQRNTHQISTKSLDSDKPGLENDIEDGEMISRFEESRQNPVAAMMSIDSILMDGVTPANDEPLEADPPAESSCILLPHVTLGQIMNESRSDTTSRDSRDCERRGGIVKTNS